MINIISPHCYYHVWVGKNKAQLWRSPSPSDRDMGIRHKAVQTNHLHLGDWRNCKCMNQQARNEDGEGWWYTGEVCVPSPKGMQTNYFKIPVLAKQNPLLVEWPVGDCFSPPELGPLLKLPWMKLKTEFRFQCVTTIFFPSFPDL